MSLISITLPSSTIIINGTVNVILKVTIFIYSPIHPFIHIHLFTHSSGLSFIHPFIVSFIFIYSPIHPFIYFHLFTNSSFHSYLFIHPLTLYSFIEWLKELIKNWYKLFLLFFKKNDFFNHGFSFKVANLSSSNQLRQKFSTF